MRSKHASDAADAHLHALIESTQDLIISVDLDYRLLTFNRAFAEYIEKNWGVTAAVGMGPGDLLSPSQAALWPPLFSRALTEGPFRAEYTLRDDRWLELSFNPITVGHQTVGISVFGKDITERKLADEFRKTSEKRFRTLVEKAPSAIAIGRDGVIRYVNQKYVEMFGLRTAREAIGHPIRERCAPLCSDVFEERIHLRARGVAVPAEYETVGLRGDGTQFPVHIAVAIVELADGPASVAFLTDISRQKQNEEALREREARFRSYFNLPLVGMAMTSPKRGFIAVNDRVCDILGYSREELLRGDWGQLTHPDDLEANSELLRRMQAGEVNQYSMIKRYIRKDGQTIWTAISVGCVRKADGSMDYACLTMQDISERKRAEDALQASEARFRTLVENAPGAIAISRKTVILYVNRKCAEMFGYRDTDAVVGRSAYEIFDTETTSVIEGLLQRHLDANLTSAAFEGSGQRPDGSRFPVRVEVGVVELPDGPAFLNFLADITEQKAAEEAVREADRQYREIFAEAPEGIFRVTKKGALLAVNPAGAKMFGYASPEQAVAAGGDLASVLWLHPQERAHYIRLLEERGEIRDFQCEFKCLDGSTVWVSLSARRVRGKDGQTAHYQGFFENISEKKRLEQAFKDNLREIQLLSEMNNALLHATSEKELLRQYCRILVEVGGYRMAWVGFADNGPEKRMIPVAHYGHDLDLLQTITVTWDESVYGNGATGQAVKSGKIVMVEDFANDPRTRPWHSEAARVGYRSVIAIPFHHSEEDMACLTAYGSSVLGWSEGELRLMEQIASALGFGITTLRTSIARDRFQRDLHASLEQTIEVISETVDQRDPYTTGHQKRVADLCSRIAEKMKFDPYRIQGLRLAATILDLGKIGVPAEILAKPCALTPIQYELIKEHAQLGHDIVKNVSFPWAISDMILQHHERMDGSGYPQGLRGDAILPEARILGVADVVEAMSSHRPYRPAWGMDVALGEILKGRGTRYDLDVVDACLSVFHDDGYQFPE